MKVKESQSRKVMSMSVLSDNIELFIKDMLEASGTDYVLRRNELDEYFGCAPSQINYVLQTRFTPERGYIIESRRGGGGCIRIIRADISKRELCLALIENKAKNGSISERGAKQLLTDLLSLEVISEREGRIIFNAVNESSLPAGGSWDVLRLHVLKNALAAAIV